MEVYIYDDQLYCETCAQRIISILDRNVGERPWDNIGHRPWNEIGDRPKPVSAEKTEKPKHCADCSSYLEQSLSGEGIEFVLQAIRDDRPENGGRAALRLWAATARESVANGSRSLIDEFLSGSESVPPHEVDYLTEACREACDLAKHDIDELAKRLCCSGILDSCDNSYGRRILDRVEYLRFREYSLVEAANVLSEVENVEELNGSEMDWDIDCALWAGQNPCRAIRVRAAYSYQRVVANRWFYLMELIDRGFDRLPQDQRTEDQIRAMIEENVEAGRALV